MSEQARLSTDSPWANKSPEREFSWLRKAKPSPEALISAVESYVGVLTSKGFHGKDLIDGRNAVMDLARWAIMVEATTLVMSGELRRLLDQDKKVKEFNEAIWGKKEDKGNE
jgi:hypothetical protein